MRYGFSLIAASLTVLLFIPSAQAANMRVQHEKVLVRSAPQPFAAKAFELKYQDRVKVQETRGTWIRIQDLNTGKSGWAPTKSFKKASFSLGASTAGVGSADETEIAAAGKGFSAEVESGLKNKNAELTFEWVDRMETWVVREDQMREFLKAGKLAAAKGATP